MSCPILTDQQRVAVKPWFFAAAVLWGAAFVSYLAAGIYMAVSYFTSAWYLDSEILGMWVLGTVGARMLGTDICLRQMQKISGEPARSWYGFALKLMSVILAFCLVFFMLR